MAGSDRHPDPGASSPRPATWPRYGTLAETHDDPVEILLADGGILGSALTTHAMTQYRYQLKVDGNHGSHYVPVREDGSDLVERYRECLHDPRRARQIARACHRRARQAFSRRYLLRTQRQQWAAVWRSTVGPITEQSLMRCRSLWQALVKQIPQRRRHRASIRLAKLLRRRLPGIVNGCLLGLDLTEDIQRAMFFGEYEPEQTAWTRECLHAGDVVIDVGANFGYHTFLASSLVGPTGAVFAFEPSPLASATLTAGVRRNNLANVTITQAAVGNEAGRAALFGEESDELHSPSLVQVHSGLKSVDVPILRLDDFEPLKDDDTVIRLMKIDVEGYEPNVLTGARRMLQEGRVENIFCEFNSGWLERNDSTIMQLKDQFAALDYHIYRQTPFRRGLKGYQGEPYDMVDIWYRRERPNTPS